MSRREHHNSSAHQSNHLLLSPTNPPNPSAGMGNCTTSLALGCDCLGAIHYFDAVLNDRKGIPVELKKAICMHEEDVGLLWKHVDYRTGHSESRRSRRLVVSFLTTVVYVLVCVYGLGCVVLLTHGLLSFPSSYTHTQQLRIPPLLVFLSRRTCRVRNQGAFSSSHHLPSPLHAPTYPPTHKQLTGQLSTNALSPGETKPEYGVLVDPLVNAQHHQHMFCARLDMAVDDPEGGAGKKAKPSKSRFPPPPPPPPQPQNTQPTHPPTH